MRFKKTDKEAFATFFKLREEKQYTKALGILKDLSREHKNNSVIAGLFGTHYYETGDFRKSAYYFKKATRLNPKSEVASLGLYHSLVHLNHFLAALKEIVRYTDYYKPKLYRETIGELLDNFEDFTSTKEKNLIEQLGKRV